MRMVFLSDSNMKCFLRNNILIHFTAVIGICCSSVIFIFFGVAISNTTNKSQIQVWSLRAIMRSSMKGWFSLVRAGLVYDYNSRS